MKSLKRILAVLICISIVCSFEIAVFANEKYFAESFNSYATNSSPAEFSLNTDKYYIAEYAEGEKGLAILADRQSATLSADLAADKKFCFSFDIMSIKNAVDGTITLVGNEGKIDIFKLSSDKRICAYNNQPLFGYNNTRMTSIAVVYDGERKECDIYRDGKCVADGMRLSSGLIGKLTSIQLSIMSEEQGRGIIIDNICVSNASKPDKAHYALINKADYNSDIEEAREFSYGAKIGSDVLFNADFESSVPAGKHTNGSIIDQYKDEDGNTAMLFERGSGTGDFHMTASGFIPASDSVVFEYRLKVLDPNSVFNLAIKDTNNVEGSFGSLTKGGVYKFGTESVRLTAGKWYKFGVVINSYDRTATYYADGELACTVPIGGSFAVGAVPSLMRIHCTIYSTFGTTATFEDSIKFLVDDMRVYEGVEPVEDLGDIKRNIKLDSGTIMPSDSSIKKSLEGYLALHTSSGVVYANGKKSKLASNPYQKDGVTYVNAAELASAFGVNTSLSGDVSLSSFASDIHKTLVTDSSTINGGLAILGSSAYKLPTSAEELQDLNDFIFFYRPSVQEVKELYAASPQYGVHPRIQATKADFDRIRKEVQTDSYKNSWSQQIIRAADSLIKVDPVVYELRDGVRLLYVSRDVLSNMYTLGMAYQLTGDKRYPERAWLDLNAVCKEFYDWHPSHDIDLGEMAAAVAIGYDWMYDGFTPEQRAVIENGAYQNGLYHASMAYQTSASPMGTMALGSANHNIVCNGGITMMSLAFMDVYPEECAYTLSNALRSAEICIVNFAPDGAWYEGPHYWEYTMQYTSKMISTVKSAFGTDLGWSKLSGLSTAADFMIYMQSSEGIYNYGDGIQTTVYAPEMLWLAHEFANAETTSVYMTLTGGNLANNEDRALGLLWYDIDASGKDISMPTDRFYSGENSVSMRASWTDTESAFVGIHAGKTNVPHSQLDGGSFIYDYNGIRWAVDLGMGDYNLPGYWDSTGDTGRRWKVFKSRAESHNTIVVNPSDLSDHRVDSFAKMEFRQSKERGAIAVVDTTELLRDVSTAQRGFFFTDNRKSLVVRDEVVTTKNSDIYWFMMTNAEVETDATGATLYQEGRTVRLDFVSNVNAKIEAAIAEPLPTSPEYDGNGPINGVTRIIIKATGVTGEANITVKLTPEGIDGTDISEYNVPISSWTVPDGAVPTPPSIEEITINGETIKVTAKNMTYTYVEGDITSVPQITVPSDAYKVEITDASTLDDATKIVVTDKNDAANRSIYNVSFRSIPKPKQFDAMVSLPITNVTVSAEPQPENNALNVLDNDIGTRWSAEGVGQWVTADVGSVKKLDKVVLAFYLGHQRQTKLTISVSKDGYEYEEVFRGMSSGTTDSYEFYDLGGKDARYVMIGCDGTTTGTWNSVSEIVVIEAQ